jgi:hypothetical protein
MSRQQVNLFQAPFRRERQTFAAVTMLRAAGALVAAVALFYGISLWQVTSQRSDLQQIEAQTAVLKKRIEELPRRAQPAEKSRQIEEEIARAERELVALANVQQVLQDKVLANTRGYSEYLAALARQHVEGVWLTGFGIAGAGDHIQLQGRTIDPARVLRYVQRLASEQTLAGAEFEVFQMARPPKEKDGKQAAPFIEFQIRTAAKDAAGEAQKP